MLKRNGLILHIASISQNLKGRANGGVEKNDACEYPMFIESLFHLTVIGPDISLSIGVVSWSMKTPRKPYPEDDALLSQV